MPSAFTALIWLLSFRFAPSWKKSPALRGSKGCRVSAERDDFATALEHLATCRDAYSPIITRTPPWSPDDPQPPELERRNGTLKTVYVKEPAGPDDARP